MGESRGRRDARMAIVCAMLMFTLPWIGAMGTVGASAREDWDMDPGQSEPWTLVGWSYHPDGPTYLGLFARANGSQTQFRLDGQISKGTVESVVKDEWWQYAEEFFVVIRVYTDDGDGWHLNEPDENDPDSEPGFDDGEGEDTVHIEVKRRYDWNQGSQQFKDYDLGSHDIDWDGDLRWTFWVGCGGNDFEYRSSNSIWSSTIDAWSDSFEGIAVACSLVSAALYFAAVACTVTGVAAPLAPFFAAAGFGVDVFVVVSYIVHCSVELAKANCDYLMTALAGDARLERNVRFLDPGDIEHDHDNDPGTPDVPVYPNANRLVHVDADNEEWMGRDSFEDDTTGASPLDTGRMKGVCLATGGVRKVGAHFSIEGHSVGEPAEAITRIESIAPEIVHSMDRENTINESWYSKYFDPAGITLWADQMLSLNGQPLLLVRFDHEVDYETKHFGTTEPSGVPPWPSATQTFNGRWMVWGMDAHDPSVRARQRDFEVQWRYPDHPDSDDVDIVLDVEALIDLIEENTVDRTWLEEHVPDWEEFITWWEENVPDEPGPEDIYFEDPRLKALYMVLLEMYEQADGAAT